MCLAMVLILACPALSAKVTITFAARLEQIPGVKNVSFEQVAQVLIAQFNKDYPDIDVKYVPLEDNWREPMSLALPIGTAPDIIEVTGHEANVWIERGFFLDLDSYMSKDKKEVESADFYPGDLRSGVVANGIFKGERFGLPRFSNASVLYFNSNAFLDSGLVTPDIMSQGGIWNWDNLRLAAKKLTKTDGTKVTRYGYGTSLEDGRFSPWIWAAGGTWFNSKGQIVLDALEAVTGLNFLHTMVWNDRTTSFSSAFEKGQVVLAEQGSAHLGTYENSIGADFAWNIAPLPVGPAGVTGNWTNGDMWAISRKTKNPQAAWTFLKFLTSRQGTEIMTQATGFPPIRFSAYGTFRNQYPDRNVIFHMKAASGAQVLPYRTAAKAKDVAAIIDATIRAALGDNSLTVDTACSQASERIRLLYGVK